MTEFCEQYNKLLGMLIIQATNDINQFYEIKVNDLTGQSLIYSHKQTLSKQSHNIISEIENLANVFYNKFYYPTLQSECLCGIRHTHNNYSKIHARLNADQLELEIHYLLEPLTRTRLSWKIFKNIDGYIPQYIIIKINLLKS